MSRLIFVSALLFCLVLVQGCATPAPPAPPVAAPIVVPAQPVAEETKPAPPPEPVVVKPPEPKRELEPWEKLTKKEIDEITYEDCEDDFGVTFPFAPDFDRVGDDDFRKNSFKEWREKLDNWDCNREENTAQKVRNYVSLMALVDVMQMEWEAETPLILYERMLKEIPKEELIKAAAYCALKPEIGPIMDKCPDIDIEDGASEDRVRDRVSIYAKKVLGRVLGKLPPKFEEPQK